MKICYFLPLIGIASASSVALEPLNEAQMIKFTSQAQKATIGKQSHINLTLSEQFAVLNNNGQSVITRTLSHPNASYLKLHFKNMDLRNGGKLIVRSEDGSERYEYTQNNMRSATINPKNGDDGVHSFSAMSVSAEKVVVEYMPGVKTKRSAEIDYYFHGTENETLKVGSDIGVSSTCGAMERKDVQCWADSNPVEFERTRPVARLLMNGSGLCTGWRVGSDNRMFTNNHCVESASELTNTEVWFNYQHTSCDGSDRETVIKVTGKDFLKTDFTLDYTLFTVNDFEKAQPFGYFGLDVRAATQGERIYIAQHGAGNPKELSIVSDVDDNGLCQVNEDNANGRGEGTDLGYYCDTTGGSSGSPVLAAATNRVIALHHLGGCTNKGAKVNLIWPQVAEHFGGQIPKGDNEQPRPTAEFNFSCDALNCEFDGTNSSTPAQSIVSYEWQFNDGSNSDSGATVSHDFPTSGNFNVTLTVTDDTGEQGTVTHIVSVDDGSDPARLQDGVAKTNISVQTGEEVSFYIDVPQGVDGAEFTISGGSGDADLYVKKGAVPTRSSYDCRPYRFGNNEVCEVLKGEGRYHVTLRAWRSFNNVRLIAVFK